MNNDLQKLIKKLNLNSPTTEDQIQKIEKHFQIKFPSEYVEFMLQSSGAEGFVNEEYLKLWKVEDLPQMNEGYKADEFFPGLILFGSDGGGEAYAFDKKENMSIVNPPFIGSSEDIRKCGKTFTEFLQYLFDKK